MAVAIVLDRVQRLNQNDRDDLFELVKVLPTADPEEFESCVVTMREILEQAPSGSRKMDCPSEPNSPKSGLLAWISFISKRIAKERQAAGLTQAQLAQKAGLLQSHISRLETGKHSPSHATISKIAKALGKPASMFDPSAD